MDASVLSALIAAVVSTLGVGVALYSSKHQLATKLSELDLKREELENFSKKLTAETDALRQNLMRDILAKRMIAYGALWKVYITYERNWLLEKKAFDVHWAETFVRELNVCNAEHGVFFSQQVYTPFFEFRKRLLGILSGLLAEPAGALASQSAIESLIEVSSLGVKDEMLALGTAMKDDLGSYMRVAIQT